jgi:stage IV sporulation protein B
MRKIIRLFTALLSLVCAVIMGFVIVGEATMPSKLVSYTSDSALSPVYSYTRWDLTSDYQRKSTARETVRAFNIFPVKDITVTNERAPKVLVSGEVFGIKLYTDGVVVVGLQSVDTGEGNKICPASECGIEVGDIVTSINGIQVLTSDDVMAILGDNNGKPYTVKLKRRGRYKTFSLTPVYSPREGSYKAGMWMRDSTAGIGTLTFYNEKNGSFAALGHQVNDVDTNELMPMLDGEAVAAQVTGVQQAGADSVGSLSCNFKEESIGRLFENSDTGLYGAYSRINTDAAREFELASKQEVQKGYAQLICTIDGGKPHAYDIEIIKVSYHRGAEQKDIVFRVTDEELLKKTGGIVQGMSGSPIVQNDKLIGAVTHVIVGNSRKGYAVFAQTMYEKSLELKP